MGKQKDIKKHSVADNPGDRPLTRKQELFVKAFCGEAAGNATRAAELAGYSGTIRTIAVTANENLKKPNIIKAIAEIDKNNPKIKTPDELREWWSKMIDNPEYEPRDRLKAASDLARASSMFSEKRIHEFENDPLQIVFHYPTDDPENA